MPYVFITFPCGVLGQVWYLIVSISDLCLPPYFKTKRSHQCSQCFDFVWSLFCWAVLSVVSSFAIISLGEEIAGFFTLITCCGM